MASVVDKLRRWLRSPQGRQTRARAGQMARDPRTKAKLRGLLSKRKRRY